VCLFFPSLVFSISTTKPGLCVSLIECNPYCQKKKKENQTTFLAEIHCQLSDLSPFVRQCVLLFCCIFLYPFPFFWLPFSLTTSPLTLTNRATVHILNLKPFLCFFSKFQIIIATGYRMKTQIIITFDFFSFQFQFQFQFQIPVPNSSSKFQGGNLQQTTWSGYYRPNDWWTCRCYDYWIMWRKSAL